MASLEVLLGIIEAICWYFFFWFALDSTNRRRNPWIGASVLITLFYIAFFACPWVRATEAFQSLN